MMRRSLRPTTALKLGAGVLLVLVAVWVLTPGLGADAGHERARASRAQALAGRAAAAAPATRSWRVTLAPAPDDLALAQVSFAHASGGARLSARSLRVAVTGPFGDDYMAMAASRVPATGVQRALVLLVNRPSPLLDPVSVHLTLSALWSLGEPVIRTLADAFARRSAVRPELCDLPLHGLALGGSQLDALGSRGAPLAGFSAAGAVAQAYDVTCGLPYSSAFARAVEPSPAPAPPVGKVPGEGCEPTPGRACPLALGGARAAGGPAARGAGTRRALAGAH